MNHIRGILRSSLIAFVLGMIIVSPVLSQEKFKAPETVLPEDMLRVILDEVSGQQAFNNEVMMAGYNRIRTPEEMSGYFYEADYLYKKLMEYGLDKVTIESLKLKRPDRGTWWIGHDAELRMIEPEGKLLARLAEQPALIIRGSDTVDCKGELVFIDKPDLPKLAEMDFACKIILTPLYASWMAPAFEKGALGVISYENSIRPIDDPDQVVFNMRFEKGKTKNKVFGFMISTRQGIQLRELLLGGRKVVVQAKTETKDYPWKADTVFAAIPGTSPEKKGLLFTAHMFERPAKIGANDNISGCVVLAEVARTLTVLIREGKISRPERSLYFLWSEEGSGTAAFFQNHPEMTEKIMGDINMDMVGENLDQNSAIFFVVAPPYSKATYLTSVVKNMCEYVFQTNIEQHGIQGDASGERFPRPIVEKNGSRQSFRYLVQRFSGGSDHGIFIESDADIPALSMIAWPDFWYHTDKDLPDKSDPTQLKRVAFIGTCSALAVASGQEEILEALAKTTYQDGQGFVLEAFKRGLSDLSSQKSADGGKNYRNAQNYITQSVLLIQKTLGGIHDLTSDKAKVDKYLTKVIDQAGQLLPFYAGQVKNYYKLISEREGFHVEYPKPTADEIQLAKTVPVKVNPVLLGEFFPFGELFGAFRKDTALQAIAFIKLSGQTLIEMYILIDGKRNLAQIRDLLSFEYDPLDVTDFLKLAKALEAANLIRIQ